MVETISVLVSKADPSKGIFGDGALTIANIPLDKLKANLSDLIAKVGAVTADLATTPSGLTLKDLEVGIEITAEGGVNLIGSAKAGATASLKLTFVRGL